MQTVGRFAPSPSGRMHLETCCARCCVAEHGIRTARSCCGSRILTRCAARAATRISLWTICAGSVSTGTARCRISPSGRRFMKNTSRSCVKGAALSVLLLPGALHAASAPHLSDGRVLYAGTCRGLTPAEIEKAEKTCTCNARARARRDHLVYRRRVRRVQREPGGGMR